MDAKILERFWSKVEKHDVDCTCCDGCWVWTACLVDGYGQFGLIGRKRVRAHRFAYELLIGPIPERLTLDHRCRNRACVNPAHLEPVSSGENVLRGIGITAQNARKEVCDHGHPLSGENLGIDHRGNRYCRTCTRRIKREAQRRRVARLGWRAA